MKSGQPKTISIYFDTKLHPAIKKRAKEADMSLSQYMRQLARKDIADGATKKPEHNN